ncbi:hypothetical protein [Nonomuraea fuscirosea]|uniref:hypothetical protein n=1 Tax=Nonomuraea fuscirosea TaxID=1291556 RepID=UPI003412F301
MRGSTGGARGRTYALKASTGEVVWTFWSCPGEGQFGKAIRPVPFYAWGGLYTPRWDRATIIFPGAGGGADWAHLSYNPHTGWIYIGFSNGRDGRVNTSHPLGEYFAGGIAAVDPRTNTPVWTLDREWSLAHGNGILTTAGRVMFQGVPTGCCTPWTTPTAQSCGASSAALACTPARSATRSTVSSTSRCWRAATACRTRTSPRAFKIGGKVPPAPTPTPPKKRNDIRAAAVTGTTITLGRIWDTANQQPGATENTVAQNAMSPQHLRMPKGTTVTFVNPADNANAHTAVSFFEYEFDTGVLMPGQSFTHTFDTPGEYFCNDAIFPQDTGEIVVF